MTFPRTPIVLVLLLFQVIIALAQTNKHGDSLYIKSFTDKIIIKANLDTQTDTYDARLDDGSELVLSANNQYRMFLSLDYEFIGASIGFAPSFLPGNDDDSLKGKTDYQDYRFRFFFNKWTQEVHYKKVQGFYVENTGDFSPSWIEGQDPYIQFSDFKTTSYSGSTSYVLNPKFSLRNVEYNTAWQIKNAGSFIPTLRYSYNRLSATLGVIKEFENSWDISLAPEYYHTFVVKKHGFIALSLAPAIGVRFSKSGVSGAQTVEKNTYYPLSFDGGLQLGYSSRKIIYGANFDFETTWYKDSSDTRIINDRVFAKLYFGYRFDAPKIVQNTFEKINTALGL